MRFLVSRMSTFVGKLFCLCGEELRFLSVFFERERIWDSPVVSVLIASEPRIRHVCGFCIPHSRSPDLIRMLSLTVAHCRARSLTVSLLQNAALRRRGRSTIVPTRAAGSVVPPQPSLSPPSSTALTLPSHAAPSQLSAPNSLRNPSSSSSSSAHSSSSAQPPPRTLLRTLRRAAPCTGRRFLSAFAPPQAPGATSELTAVAAEKIENTSSSGQTAVSAINYANGTGSSATSSVDSGSSDASKSAPQTASPTAAPSKGASDPNHWVSEHTARYFYLLREVDLQGLMYRETAVLSAPAAATPIEHAPARHTTRCYARADIMQRVRCAEKARACVFCR